MKDDADLSRIMKGFKASGDPYFYFWTALRKHFLLHGSNQTRFAERLGVDQSYLSRVLAGTKIPTHTTHTTQEKMASGLGMTISGLLDEGKELLAATPPPSLSLVPPNYASVKAHPAFVPPTPASPGALRFIVPAEKEGWAWGVDSPLQFDPGWLGAFGDPAKLGVFKALEALMQPAIPKGGLVVVDTAATAYIDGAVYLLEIFGDMFFARFKFSNDPKPMASLVYDEGGGVFTSSVLPLPEGGRAGRQDQRALFTDDPAFCRVGRAVLVVNPLT